MRRRRPLVVVSLAAALLAAACSGGGGDRVDPAPGTTAPTGPTTTAPATQGMALVVAEQGLTTFADPYTPGQTLGGYGVVLQNPDPNLLAAGVHVTTQIKDAAGSVLLTDSSLLNGIMPGQRMAVGRTIIESIAGPASLDVRIEVAAWLPPAAGTGQLRPTEAITEPELGGGAVTRFGIQSGAAGDEDGVDVAALYRAADGHLLSVEMTSVDKLPAGQVVVGQIRLLAPIPGVASTEVLVGRGLSAQITG